MEKKVNEIAKEPVADFSEKKITRKEAIKKAGYAAVSTATMMILLNKNAQANPNASGAPTKGANIGGGTGHSSGHPSGHSSGGRHR